MPLVNISNIERNDTMLFILEKNIFLKHIKLDEISQDADILMRFKQDSMMYVCIKIEEYTWLVDILSFVVNNSIFLILERFILILERFISSK